jgi:hypothetical protein
MPSPAELLTLAARSQLLEAVSRDGAVQAQAARRLELEEQLAVPPLPAVPQGAAVPQALWLAE